MTLMVVMYVVLCLVGLGLFYPMVKRKIKPNLWYGFRTRRTLSSPDIWYPANEYAGRILMISFSIMLVLALLLALIPNISVDAYVTIWTAIMLVLLAYSLIASLRYVRQLPSNGGKD